MKLFGLEISSSKKMNQLIEAITLAERQLEDIGWIRMNDPQSQSHTQARESYENMVRRCRLAYIKNPIIAQALHLTTWYTFGDGITQPRSKDTELEKIVADFWTDPDNQLGFTGELAQMKLSNKLQYDGELMLALQVDTDGSVYVRPMDPLGIVPIVDKFDTIRNLFYLRSIPGGKQYIPDYANGAAILWNHGELTDEWVKMLKELEINEKEVLKQTYLYHVKINSDILDRRGIPEVYRALDWMNANAGINSDTASFIRAQAQYAWNKKITGTKGQINQAKSRIQQNTGLTNPAFQAGSTYMHNDKIEMNAVGLPASSAKLFETGIRQSLLMMIAAFGLMEHYFGDPSTGNLATSKSMELPMLKKFQARRKIWKGIFNDVLQFDISMKLMAINKNMFDYNELNNRLKPSKGRGFKDRHIDIEFPPILDEDISLLADAMDKAKKGMLIPTETAQRFMLQGMKITNIEEEMDKDFDDPPPPPQPFGQPPDPNLKPKPKAKKKAKAVKKPLKEAVSTVPKDLEPQRSKSLTIAETSKDMLRKLNGYVKLIAGNFNEMLAETNDSMSLFMLPSENWVFRVENIDRILKRFEEKMLKAASKYYPQITHIGESYVKSQVQIRESDHRIVEARLDSFIDDQLDWNRGFVENSLMPKLKKKLVGLRQMTFESEMAATKQLNETLAAMETQVGKYGGSLWTVGQRAIPESGKGTEAKANFVGVEDLGSCTECVSAIQGNPWPLSKVPIPGEQICQSNCRHAIQIVGDEDLSEADITMLRDAETESKAGFKLLKVEVLENEKP